MFKMYTPAARSAMFIEPFTNAAPVFFPNTSKSTALFNSTLEEKSTLITFVAGLGYTEAPTKSLSPRPAASSLVRVQPKDGKSAPIRPEISVQSVAPAPNKSSGSISKDAFAGAIPISVVKDPDQFQRPPSAEPPTT
jgi:hypothetical protein